MPPLLHKILNSSLGPRPWRTDDLNPESFCQSLFLGRRNFCPRTGGRWVVLKLFHLRTFPQNKTSWVFPTAVALSFLRTSSFSQKILKKWSKHCFTSVMCCIELLCLRIFSILQHFFWKKCAEGICLWVFPWVSEMELSNMIQYYC